MAKPSPGVIAPTSLSFSPASDQSTVAHLKVTVQVAADKPDGTLVLAVTSGNVAFAISITDLPVHPEYKRDDRLILEYPKGENPMLADYSAIYHADKVSPPQPQPSVKKEIMSNLSTQTVQTMSSLELVKIINELREEGKAELRHDNFMAKIENHPGIDSPKFLGQYKDSTGRTLKCYYLPKRECELMVMSESLEVQAKVYDRMTALEQQALQGGAKTPPPSIIAPSREFRALFGVGRLLGLDKNAAAISANQAVNKITGVNLLSLLGQTSMEAGNQSEMLYTPTDLGKRIGVSGIAFNKMLEAAGLQKRQGDTWERTQLAETFSKIQDTMKRHSDGTPVLQLKWYPSVIQMLNLEPKAA